MKHGASGRFCLLELNTRSRNLIIKHLMGNVEVNAIEPINSSRK